MKQVQAILAHKYVWRYNHIVDANTDDLVDVTLNDERSFFHVNKGTNVNSKDLIKILQTNGWRHIRTHGSHHIFKKDGFPKSIAVPHPKKDLKLGTAKDILKKAGVK